MKKGSALSNLDLPYKEGSKPDEIWICCPFCITRRGKPDHSFKMGVNTRTGLFGCFKCRANRHNSSLSFLQNLEFYQKEAEDMASLLDTLNRPRSRPARSDPPIDLNRYSVPLDPNETPLAYDYATIKRGLSEDDISKYGLRVGKAFWTTDKDGNDYESKRWCNRLIFPFYEKGEPQFMVGRTYVDNPIRYMNSDDRNKDRYVYGIDDVLGGVAILCEGILSSIAATRATGIPSISTLGYYCTELQALKIAQVCDRVYVSLDGGVSSKVSARLEAQLLSLGLEVYRVTLPGEDDPDDLGPEYLKYFEQAEQISLF